MSERRVPLEQPGFVEDEPLRTWLTRMMILINGAFASAPDFTPTGVIPTHITDGMVRYFNQDLSAIDPQINAPGPYMVVEGTWQKMT
jgi:hypothetical protein